MNNLTKYLPIAVLSTAALLMATPASAQSTTPERSDAPAAVEQPAPDGVDQKEAIEGAEADETSEMTVTVGQEVWSSDGKELGKVSSVNVDDTGKLESIYFDVGTTLGLGGKTVMSEAADFSQNDDRIELTIDAEAAQALPEVTE